MDSCSNDIDNQAWFYHMGTPIFSKSSSCPNFSIRAAATAALDRKTLQRGVRTSSRVLGLKHPHPVSGASPLLAVVLGRCCVGPKDVPKPTGGSFESVNIWGWIWWRVTQQLKRVGRMDKSCVWLLGAGFFNIVYFHPEFWGRFSILSILFRSVGSTTKQS